MGKTFGIGLVPVLGGVMPGGTPVTLRGEIYQGYKLQFFGASKLLEGLIDIGGDSL